MPVSCHTHHPARRVLLTGGTQLDTMSSSSSPTAHVAVYVSAPWRMGAAAIEAALADVRAAAAASGASLVVLRPWWTTGGVKGLDAGGLPLRAAPDAAPHAVIDALTADRADAEAAIDRAHAVLVLAGDGMKSTPALMGYAAAKGKPVIVVSQTWADWRDGVDGATRPEWSRSLAFAPNAYTRHVATPADAGRALVPSA